MQGSKPLVSVIIPNYNRLSWLNKTIKSVENQTYRPLELIIVDDGSTDGSRELLRSWESTCNTSNGLFGKVFLQKNSGAPVARNRGLYESSGKYIVFLDSDDLLLPQKVFEEVALLEDFRLR